MSWVLRTEPGADRLPPERIGVVVGSGPQNALSGEVDALVAAAGDGNVLRLMTPVLDDERVVEALVAARRRGVEVRALTALLDRQRVVTKGWDGEGRVESHAEYVRQLARTGALLRSTESTPHGKLLLLDGDRGVFGSANLTTGSLRGASLEAAVIEQDRGTLEALQAAFDAVWRNCPYKMTHREGSVTLTESSPVRITFPEHGWSCGESQVVLSSPGGVSPIATHLSELVEAAKTRMLFVALSFYELDQVPQLGTAIEAALRRGVHVQVIVRTEHFKPEQYPDRCTREWIALGLDLRGARGLHAKGFLVDDAWSGMHSANFNPYSLDTQRPESNVELALLGRTTVPSLQAYSAWLQCVWEGASHRWDPSYL